MNKLTPIISKYLTVKYRGVESFQQENFLDNINNIMNFLDYVNLNGGFIDVRTRSKSFESFCSAMSQTSNELRKNIFPSLERIGLIKRNNRGNSWNSICLTEDSKNILSIEDDRFKLSEAIRKSFHKMLDRPDFRTAIYRLEDIIDIWGKIYWWEIWFCFRTEIDFDIIKQDIKSIRQLYSLKNFTIHKITEITKDFDKHNISKGQYNPFIGKVAVKNNGTIDLKNLRNKISNALGVKLAHFGFKIDGKSFKMTLDVILSRKGTRVSRTSKRTKDLLVSGDITNFDYHHIVSFDNSHYNPKLHKEIDDTKNLIPITNEDHKKFPNKNNPYLIMKLEDSKVRFYSVTDESTFVELEYTDHLDLVKLVNVYIPYNKNLYKKVI